MTFGRASHGFLASPGQMTTPEFLGVGFLIVIVALAWARFINEG